MKHILYFAQTKVLFGHIGPGRCSNDFKNVVFETILLIDTTIISWKCSHVNATDPIDNKSTFVQVMAWCGK